MSEIKMPPGTGGKEKTNREHDYSTTTAAQRQRILAWLRSQPITTMQACWQAVDTGKAQHRVAEYVLLSGVNGYG